MNRQKRWNNGSPPHRIAVNLVRRYKKQLKPRVMPFFCDKCRLSTRTLSHILGHVCDREEKRKADRKEAARKFSLYDCAAEIKMALNAEKQWRYNGMAVMEQTLKPEKVCPKPVHIVQAPKETQYLDHEPSPEFFAAQEQEFDDETPHYPLEEVLIPSTQIRPKTTLKPSRCLAHPEPGVFCFHCKGSFDSYNQYQLHLRKEFSDGVCSRSLPSYYYVEREDRTGMFNKEHRHSVMHHVPVERDVSHIRCTLCKTMNFASTGDLYSHMIKCASTVTPGKGSPIDCPTAFGYGMPPSFNACQYVFPDPVREKAPRTESVSAESSSSSNKTSL
ncbi:unnamed protein product [Caenorhabditis sp. 36 PRJEB53466]|nr:unnamed protein product [Caenorhabditis sp. 36 PRJEB53466]